VTVDISEMMLDPELTETFTVRRPTGSYDGHGQWRATYADTAVVGIAQPMSPREVEMLPEGSRIDNMMSFWSAVEMKTADGNRAEADVIVYQGASYKVVKVNPWGPSGYWKAMAEGFIPS
jgi:hypothetical protein